MSTTTTTEAPAAKTTVPRAKLEDLLHVEGKAELIAGKVVQSMGTGFLPNRIAGRIFIRLDDYAESTRRGVVGTDGLVFGVPQLPSGRESFSPDASLYVGPLPTKPMRFIEGPPTFAVEVRSEGDYGRTAERDMAAKRADYFLAGTLVVWDVDPVAETVAIYRADTPETPTLFHRGETADAEPAAPGWRLAVDDIFRS